MTRIGAVILTRDQLLRVNCRIGRYLNRLFVKEGSDGYDFAWFDGGRPMWNGTETVWRFERRAPEVMTVPREDTVYG